MKLLWLMLAGGLGAGSRYGLTLLIQNWLAGRGARFSVFAGLGMTFPLATLIINVAGSFLLAFLTALALHGMVKPEYRLILGTGFLGAFTTFATFELEAEGLIAEGRWLHSSIYILGNVLFGFAAIMAGRALAMRVLGLGLWSSAG